MTSEPESIIEVFLGPGQVYFGDRGTRIRTLLGSCVAITLWHPRALIGGMCHYMVPSRGNLATIREGLPLDHPLSGRYADEALFLLMQELYAADTPPNEYVVKIFGGGNQLSAQRVLRKCMSSEGVASVPPR